MTRIIQHFYKNARPDGWDWYTGNTINYREAIGKTVQVPQHRRRKTLCSNSVIHASRNPNDSFIIARLPCSLFRVTGTPVIEDTNKCGFTQLHIIDEIPTDQFDLLLGWRYTDACCPIKPFTIPAPTITQYHIQLLHQWDSVKASVGDSVWAFVWDSVTASVEASVWAFVWDSVTASVEASVWAFVWDSVTASVEASVWASVWDFMYAYIGSFFPNIAKWQYIPHEAGIYPFQPAVTLWKTGLVPSYDGTTWRLHAGHDGHVVYTEPPQ